MKSLGHRTVYVDSPRYRTPGALSATGNQRRCCRIIPTTPSSLQSSLGAREYWDKTSRWQEKSLQLISVKAYLLLIDPHESKLFNSCLNIHPVATMVIPFQRGLEPMEQWRSNSRRFSKAEWFIIDLLWTGLRTDSIVNKTSHSSASLNSIILHYHTPLTPWRPLLAPDKPLLLLAHNDPLCSICSARAAATCAELRCFICESEVFLGQRWCH